MNGLCFERLTRRDYPLLARWLAEPHVQRWWNHEFTEAALEADFGASIDGVDPAEVFIVSATDSPALPFGLLQRYRFADNPGYLDELAPLLAVPPAALSIDYFVAEPGMLRRGWGSAMIRAALADIWVDYPAAPCVVVPVHAANTASWRVLERAGMQRVASGPLTPDNPLDDPLHHVYRIVRPAG